ncbi:hypothetical protein ABTY98_38675 [Streptomyces sp. NPDC096040]|uniref:hypothetical protein n=1 Tax=Streptomyces sp. NPDC096040 TaxID=3155541 RepID=UPI003330471D
MTTPEASATVAVELERLRGTVATGFAEVKGSLAVLMARSERNEQDLVRLREDTGKDIDALRTELEALKARRWPLGVLGAVAGVVGTLTAVVSLFVH